MEHVFSGTQKKSLQGSLRKDLQEKNPPPQGNTASCLAWCLHSPLTGLVASTDVPSPPLHSWGRLNELLKKHISSFAPSAGDLPCSPHTCKQTWHVPESSYDTHTSVSHPGGSVRQEIWRQLLKHVWTTHQALVGASADWKRCSPFPRGPVSSRRGLARGWLPMSEGAESPLRPLAQGPAGVRRRGRQSGAAVQECFLVAMVGRRLPSTLLSCLHR
ncbi:uncharacterized protein LOC131489517 [Neofelis nebulosa]|uniref:uncharacterized protein LOC131489517 n=1 Tax=Neofelis nebulosa TaxID=61452 RepID=UPI00272CE311|nr:uncharacterized protein LOC131489517 [Neofelis nebulosa]